MSQTCAAGHAAVHSHRAARQFAADGGAGAPACAPASVAAGGHIGLIGMFSGPTGCFRRIIYVFGETSVMYACPGVIFITLSVSNQ